MLQQAGTDTEITHSHDTFYLVCDDADAIYKELQDKEVELEPPSVAYYGMRQLFVPDPDGRGIIFESRTEEWPG